MPDTVRTDAEILALLADNTSGAISAQDARDAYVSLLDRIDKADQPDAFTFTDLTGVNLSSSQTEPITVTGSKLPSIARATGALSFSVNGGDFVTGAVVQAGDVLTAKIVASATSLTEVTGTLNVGGVSDTWSITTGNFWTPDVAYDEGVIFAFFQEDLDDGAVTSWVSRGVQPVTATGTATKLADNGGVMFAKGTSQALQWGVNTQAPWQHRWWVAISRADLSGNPGHGTAPILSVHGTAGSTAFVRQPNLGFISGGLLKSHIADQSGNNELTNTADGTFANWNVVIGWQRGWQHGAVINGTKVTPNAYKTMAPNNTSTASWLGGGLTLGTVPLDLAIDCAIVGQSEISDDFIDLLMGWAHWRAGREDLLPVDHPYKSAAPVPGDAEAAPTRYIHNATTWAAWKAIDEDKTNLGNAPPTPDVTYSRIFFDDFLADPLVDGLTGAPSAVLYVNTDTGNVGKDAVISRLADTPACYIHTATSPGFVTLRLQWDGSKWVSGTVRTTNESGKGRYWSKGRFITRIRFTGIPAFGGSPGYPWPGFFPAWWNYSKDHEFWHTRNNIETDWFEHEGDGVEDDRMAQAIHIHAPRIPFSTGSPDEILQVSDSAGIINESNLKIATGWNEDEHLYDGAWHDYEIRIEDDFIYNILDGLEIGRLPVNQELLLPKYFIWDFALRLAQGEDPTGLGPWDMDIDTFEVWMKEADLAVVPTGFSARPTIAGTRGSGNTITLTHNTGATDQLEIRWYKGGEPIVGAESATFVEDADSATKALRVHVRNLSLLNQPEAWTAELAP